ncbi:MAG TPA: PepSY domain-containing protein [Nitrospira sp.]|nr:PepSY domain-containing protein [Nitrospira sp.]
MRVLLILLLGWSALMFGACAEEQGKSYWLRHASVTLSQAADIAETNGPGRAVGAELGHSGNRVFYDVEIIDTVNESRRLRVDAESGKIVKRND